MSPIGFTEDDLDRYLAEDPGGPVVMLNLLRFAPDGGRERYEQYGQATAEAGAAIGIELLHFGIGGRPLEAPDGPPWDAVALVRYPSRAAFAEMIRSPEYQANEHLRVEALEATVLQPTQAVQVG